jgi:ATP-dependent Lon protease
MPEISPLLPLTGAVLLPGAFRGLVVTRPELVATVEAAMEAGGLVLLKQADDDVADPLSADFAEVGTRATVVRSVALPDGSLRVLVEAGSRIRRSGSPSLRGGALAVTVAPFRPALKNPNQVRALGAEIQRLLAEWMTSQSLTPQDRDALVARTEDPERAADQAASMVEPSAADAMAILAAPTLDERLARVLDLLVTALATAQLRAEVTQRIQAAMDEGQREYQLREQLKTIRTELGEAAGPDADADSFNERIEALGMPDAPKAEALREVERMRRMHSDSAEYTIVRTWLETVCDVPWSTATTDTPDLQHAIRVLDEDHHGLDKVKERLIEYLAVRQLKPDGKGPLLCLVGPPGVGKTSLGMSIARALGRKFGRIALGGIKDETEVRGHRRTYVGALPGRILRALIRAGTRNPVLVLDEIDKVGNDFRGDPASALLEVLDPEQNHAFVDHYLDLDVDLSQVLFVATANLSDPIPPALHDRLEILEVPGYTEEDKLQIARRFLLPKLAIEHGLTPERIEIGTEALQRVIRDHTREAGVRDLQRQLARLHRKAARKFVEGRTKSIRVTDSSVPRWLGPRKYVPETLERVDQPGVAVGLAWTAAGGDILFVEATRMPGKPGLKQTGSLGDVMKESAETALSWLRTHASDVGLDATAFDAEFHVHVPAGAIPKDGPSAGVTLATALASICTGRKAKPGIAMTGEITLRGRVLPVGGIKEKVLAARRAGVHTVLLPARNQDDAEEIPADARKALTLRYVETVAEVLEAALE